LLHGTEQERNRLEVNEVNRLRLENEDLESRLDKERKPAQNDLQKDLEEMFELIGELPLSDECLTQQNEAHL
jgi:hypothetical protein